MAPGVTAFVVRYKCCTLMKRQKAQRSRDEALHIAANIAEPPERLKRPRGASSESGISARSDQLYYRRPL